MHLSISVIFITIVQFYFLNVLTCFFFSLDTKGKRFSLPMSRMMIHQPIGEIEGGDIEAMEIQVSLPFLDVFCSSLFVTLWLLHNSISGLSVFVLVDEIKRGIVKR